MKRLVKLAVALAGVVLAGCVEPPLYVFRVGEAFDVGELTRSDGEIKPSEVTLKQVNYTYLEYDFQRGEEKHCVQVSKEGRIIGLWEMLPCAESNAVDRIDLLKKQVQALYRDKLECCGAAKGAVIADIHYEQKAGCVEFTCQDRAFAEKIARNNGLQWGPTPRDCALRSAAAD